MQLCSYYANECRERYKAERVVNRKIIILQVNKTTT